MRLQRGDSLSTSALTADDGEGQSLTAAWGSGGGGEVEVLGEGVGLGTIPPPTTTFFFVLLKPLTMFNTATDHISCFGELTQSRGGFK